MYWSMCWLCAWMCVIFLSFTLPYRPYSPSFQEFGKQAAESARYQEQTGDTPQYRPYTNPNIQSNSFKTLQNVIDTGRGRLLQVQSVWMNSLILLQSISINVVYGLWPFDIVTWKIKIFSWLWFQFLMLEIVTCLLFLPWPQLHSLPPSLDAEKPYKNFHLPFSKISNITKSVLNCRPTTSVL